MFSGLLPLAFGFATPLLLWGGLLAVSPLLIHLLFRRQYRDVTWGAMQFLVAAAKRRSRWSQVDQWLLLAVRTLIPLLAALALAGPFLDGAIGSATSVPVHRVLVLDVSLSTQAREDGRTRWSRIRDAAAALVNRGKPGDTWQLYTIGGRALTPVIAEPTFLSEAVLEELRQREATVESGSLAEGLLSLAESLGRLPDGPRDVCLLTDGQRSQWHPPESGERERLHAAIAKMSESARLQWIDVTRTTLGNVAVTELTLAQPFVLTGQPLRAVATVRQFGDAAFPAVLEWRVDGRLVAAQPLSASDGPEIRRELQYVPSAPGDLRIEARITPDDLTQDDRRGAVCVVREAIRVLLVDGRPSGIPFENATDFVRMALAPEPGQGQRGRIEPTVITDGQLLSAPLDEFDIVFLCDVPQLTDREGELLADFVASGGGLVIGMGPSVRPETYHASIGTAARPLLPARIGELIGDPRRRDQSFGFTGEEFEHPILSPFRGNPNTGFELTQTFAYRRLVPSAAPGAAAGVAVTFESADPAIVEGRFGRGRVLLLATAVDRSWGTWAVWGHTFVPMLHEMVRYLLAGQLASRQVLVGEPLQTTLPRVYLSGPLQVRDPEDQRQRVTLLDTASTNVVVLERTATPGFYAVERQTAGSTPLWFAVNCDPIESDLTPMSPTELRDGLFGGIAFNDDALDETASTVQARPTPLSENPFPRWLLGGLLLLLIGEPYLAWNRRLGILVAGGLLFIGLSGWGFGSQGAVLATVVCVIIGGWLWRTSEWLTLRERATA